jgi:hypothetical protein
MPYCCDHASAKADGPATDEADFTDDHSWGVNLDLPQSVIADDTDRPEGDATEPRGLEDGFPAGQIGLL